MSIGFYNKAIGQLAFYKRMAVLAKRGTPDYTAYVNKLAAGSHILAIVCDNDIDEVDRDVRKAYDSKYRHQR